MADERVIWNEIGPPPESPWGYASRMGISEDEVPQEVKHAWRTWNTKEQELVEKAAQQASGQSAEEILTSLGYKNEADKGKSMFARYQAGEKKGVLENIAGDAFQKFTRSGGAEWDPARKMWINPGTGTWENPSEMWDEKGRKVAGQGYKNTGVLRRWGGGAGKKGAANYPQPGGAGGGGGFSEYGGGGSGFAGGGPVMLPGGGVLNDGGPGYEEGWGVSGYGGGLDESMAGFGLQRSMESYANQLAKRQYLDNLAGSVLGVNPQGAFDTTEEGGAGPEPGTYQEDVASGMLLGSQLEDLGKMTEEAIQRARREGREQDIPQIIQSMEQQKLGLKQNLQGQMLSYLQGGDPYSDLPGYRGELQADTQLNIANMDDATKRMLGLGDLDVRNRGIDVQRELGMGDLDLRRFLGEGQLDLGRSELDLKRELGFGDLDLRRELGMGDLNLRRDELAGREAADKRNWYGSLGSSAISMFGKGGALAGVGKKIGSIFGGGGGAAAGGGGAAAGGGGIGGVAGAGLLAGGAALGAGSYLGGTALGKKLGGNTGGKLGGYLGFAPIATGKGAFDIGRKLFSDLETKQDVEPYTPGLEELRMLSPIEYFYKEETFGPTEEKSAGLAAQEVENILPEAVSYDEATGMRQVDYGHVLMANVNATKEIADELDALKASIYARRKPRKRKVA